MRNASKGELRKYNISRFEMDLQTNITAKPFYRKAMQVKKIKYMEDFTWVISEKYNTKTGIVGWRPRRFGEENDEEPETNLPEALRGRRFVDPETEL